MSSTLHPGPWLKLHDELGITTPAFDDRPIGAFVEIHAEVRPDSVAIQYFDRAFTYRELNALANQFANALADLGVGRSDVIGLHMPNVPQYVAALVAISKLGATASGISPMLAPGELAHQLEDAGVKVLICLDALANTTLSAMDSLPDCLSAVVVAGANDLRQPESLKLPSLPGITVTNYLDLVSDVSDEFEQVALPPDHVFLIQYTGGTTGKPKGAMLSLRGVMFNIPISHIYRPWADGTETVASAFPLFHVAGFALMLCALKHGARSMLILDPRDMDHFCQQMVDFPPTRLAAVPTLYKMIADHPLSASIDFSGVNNAQTGAAPITGDDRKRIEAMLHGNVLSDSFGMTETGPTIVVNPPERIKPESVGFPLPGLDVRVVDVETGTREMPYGEAGEIIAASPSLMLGYRNRDDETANSLREWQGKTWMHTGDVGVMDEEGYLYIKDRAKDMLIVSGFKVFSVEVEDKLAALDFVACSAVIGQPDPNRPGSEIVNLYVELTADSKGRDADGVTAEILDYCRAQMATYKVPKVIHLIDAIPLTAVGKVDKKVLRAQLEA